MRPSFEYVSIGGAGVKAGCYLGVVEAFEMHWHEASSRAPWKEFLRNIRGCSGTSAGAVIALALCVGLTSNDLRRIFHPLMMKMMNLIPHPDIGNLVERFGLEDGTFLKTCIAKLLTSAGLSEETTFERMYALIGREFVCLGTNLNERSIAIFDRHHTPDMRVADAVFISCCMPIIFSPVVIDDVSYVDGTLTCEIPMVFPTERTLFWRLVTRPVSSISSWNVYLCSILESFLATRQRVELCSSQTVNIEFTEEISQIAAFDIFNERNDMDACLSAGHVAAFTIMCPELPTFVANLLSTHVAMTVDEFGREVDPYT